MGDIVDKAQQAEDAFFRSALTKKPEGPKPNGFCHACDAPVAEGLRWCDAACRDEWERDNPAPLRPRDITVHDVEADVIQDLTAEKLLNDDGC